MPTKNQSQPHDIARLDPPQWLRTFARQFKGETRASLEHIAAHLTVGEQAHAADAHNLSREEYDENFNRAGEAAHTPTLQDCIGAIDNAVRFISSPLEGKAPAEQQADVLAFLSTARLKAIRACNSHAALVEALNATVAALEAVRCRSCYADMPKGLNATIVSLTDDELHTARAALASARNS